MRRTIVDDWLLRKRTPDLTSLYAAVGAHRDRDGDNLAAVGATLIGAAVALAGMFWDPRRPIYDRPWFVGSPWSTRCPGRGCRAGSHLHHTRAAPRPMSHPPR